MIPREAEVLSALMLLSDAPYEVIGSHRDLALRTLTNIGHALDSPWIAGADSAKNVEVEAAGETSEPRGSQRDITTLEAQAARKDASSLPANLLNATTKGSLPTDLQGSEPSTLPKCSSQGIQRKRKRQTADDTPSAALVEAAKARLPRILDLCKSKASLSEILQTEQEMQFADKRVDHLKQVDGNKTPSDEQKLLKGLSQLSFAQQFTDWELSRGWKPKADTLYGQSQSVEVETQATSAKSTGKMGRFIREHDYPKSDHNVVRKGIKKGLNQMVFLRLLKDKLISSGHEEAVKGIIALTTIFQYASFQNLSILEFPILVNSLLHENNNSEFIRGAQIISPWFENMSGDFEMISQTTKRGRRDTITLANVPTSHIVNWPSDAGTRERSLNNLSGLDERSVRERNIDAAQPSLASHELTSFSTFPSRESTHTRRPSNPPFVDIRYTPERTEVLPTARSHDLAQFSKNTNNDCTMTNASESHLMSHDLSLFSTVPSTSSFQQTLDVPRTCSALIIDRPNPFPGFQDTPQAVSHEISSFSTATNSNAVH